MTIRPSVLLAAALVGAAIGFVGYRDWLDGATMLTVSVALWVGFAQEEREEPAVEAEAV